jgi:hypothetical protein
MENERLLEVLKGYDMHEAFAEYDKEFPEVWLSNHCGETFVEGNVDQWKLKSLGGEDDVWLVAEGSGPAELIHAVAQEFMRDLSRLLQSTKSEMSMLCIILAEHFVHAGVMVERDEEFHTVYPPMKLVPWDGKEQSDG